MALAAHQQRVLTECAALGENIDRLNAFTQDPPVPVHPDEMGRLKVQLAIMRAYRAVLDERIVAFGG